MALMFDAHLHVCMYIHEIVHVHVPWVCCVALPCLFVDLACFFLSSFASLM